MDNGKKIIIFAENYQYGGLERYLFDLANTLSASGSAVEIVHNSSAGFSKRLAENLHPSIARRSAWWLSTDGLSGSIDRFAMPPAIKMMLKLPLAVLRYVFFPFNVLALNLQLHARSADVVHIVDGGYPGSMGCLAAAMAARMASGLRVVFSVLSMPAARKIPVLDGLLDSLASRSVDVFMPNCILAGSSLCSLRGFSPSKITPVHTGLDRSSPAFDSAGRTSFRKSMGLGADERLLCFVAAFEPLKGHNDLLSAFSILLQTEPRAKLVLVGDGKTKPQIEALASKLGISSSIIFAGYCTSARVKEWVGACEVFVFPSRWEGLPYSIVEAMQSAKPIVATSVGGIPELVQDNESGLLVPPASPQKLAEALARLLANPSLASQLGRAAQKRAQEKFSLSEMVKQTKAVYFPSKP